MIKDIFYTDKYDKRPYARYKGKIYTIGEIKELSNIRFKSRDNFSILIEYFNLILRGENIVLKTSGSTGEKKEFAKSIDNLSDEIEAANLKLNLSKENLEIYMTTSLEHMFALTFAFSLSLKCGFILNLDKINYPDKINAINAFLVSTPEFLNSIKNYEIKFENPPKYIISAGSKLSFETFSYLEKQNIKVIEIYGSTETGIIAYKTKSDESGLNIFDNVKIEDFEESSKVTSPWIYEKEVILGDKLKIKDDKIIDIKRADRIIKINDKRFSAIEIEEKIKDHNFIKDAYCFAYEGKMSILCALDDEGVDFLLKNSVFDLNKRLKNYLQIHFETTPKKWRYVDMIPLNERGKTDKNLIEKMFSSNVSFPVILKRKTDENSTLLTLFFDKNCNFFKGHFPNFPILAGWIQLYFASFFANYIFKKNVGAGQIKKIKFSNIIKAGSKVNLLLENEEKFISFSYSDDDKNYSSGIFPNENIFV